MYSAVESKNTRYTQRLQQGQFFLRQDLWMVTKSFRYAQFFENKRAMLHVQPHFTRDYPDVCVRNCGMPSAPVSVLLEHSGIPCPSSGLAIFPSLSNNQII